MKGTTIRDQIIIKMLPFRICGILLHIVLLCTHIRPRTLPIHDCSMQKTASVLRAPSKWAKLFGFLEKILSKQKLHKTKMKSEIEMLHKYCICSKIGKICVHMDDSTIQRLLNYFLQFFEF